MVGSFWSCKYSHISDNGPKFQTRLLICADKRRKYLISACGSLPPIAVDCNIHARKPIPRQKRFREKGGRDDEALRIGNLLIASKVPSGIRFSAGAWPIPKSFHRGGFWRYLLCGQKVTYKNNKEKKATRRVVRVTGCFPNNLAVQRRYLRRLAQSTTPAAAEDKSYPPAGEQQAEYTDNSPLRCQSSLTFGGMTQHIAVRRTVRAAASAPRRPAIVRECSLAVPAGCRPKTFPLTTPLAL